ncbi:hypothetical protein ANTQUA_LOCUS6497 [Anthophora quadrimaculata]
MWRRRSVLFFPSKGGFQGNYDCVRDVKLPIQSVDSCNENEKSESESAGARTLDLWRGCSWPERIVARGPSGEKNGELEEEKEDEYAQRWNRMRRDAF